MDRLAVSLFDNFASAMDAITDLENNGFSGDDISVIAQDTILRRSPRLESVDLYTVLGRPHVTTFRAIGPVMGSGYIFSYMTERPARTEAYSLVEMLQAGGVPHHDANVYAEAVRRGAVMVAVRETGGDVERAAHILDAHNALVMDDYVSEWRQAGWESFDENADPMDYDSLNWPQNITAIPGERQPEPEEERNWPMDITESYEPSTESPEGESWPASITRREDETVEENNEEETIDWPHNLVGRRRDD